MSSFVRNLTKFIVEGLGNLKHLFTSSMVKSFEQLKRLEVRGCKMMAEVILREGLAEEETMCEMFFPKLEILYLDDLPKLTRFCSGNYYEFSNLSILTIMKCPLLETFVVSTVTGDMVASNEVENTSVRSLFDEKVALPRLMLLIIEHMGSLNKIWNDQLEADSFCKLKYLVVRGCEALRCIFPLNMLERLHQLEKVSIEDCGSLEDIFESQRDCAQKLQHNWVPEVPSFVLTLNELVVKCCGNLRHLLTCSVVKISFEHLKLLCVRDCKMMEGVIVTEGFAEEERIHEMFFPRMESLRLADLPKLTRFYDGNYIEFPYLTGLEISNCPVLKTFIPTPVTEEKVVSAHEKAEITFIPALFNAKVALPRLNILMIGHMESLNKIWDDRLDPHSFSKLELFSVIGCQRLQRIFPSCMLERLQGLDKLWIGKCDSLEEIHELHGLSASHSQALIVTEPTLMETHETKLVFPILTHLRLHILPSLKRFCHQIHKWPSLEKLEVVGCEQVQVFASEFSSLKRTSGHDELEIQIQCPLFWVTKATFPNLVKLKLESNNTMKEIWRGPHAGEFFPKLRFVKLANYSEQSTCLPSFFLSLPNLEKFVVSEASGQELFQYEELGGGEPALALARLSKLRLSKLNELTCLWKEEPHHESVFSNLRTLEVHECSKLKSLIPSIMSFINLHALELSRCDELINFMRYSTTKSLLQLTKLSITDCAMMEEIVACMDDEVKDGIVFNHLKCLQFRGLRRLASFCSGNCNFHFPSLEELIVIGCPNMQLFSIGELVTPELAIVKWTDDEDKGCWNGDLNTTIQELFTRKVGYYELERLVFEIPNQVISEIWNKNPEEILPFRKLKSLEVLNHSSSRYLLTSRMALGLVQLHDLKVTSCIRMEHVITGDGAEEVFPLLNSILLNSCSELTFFYKGSSTLKFPSLKQITITDCPAMVAFASVSSKEQDCETSTTYDGGTEGRHSIPIEPFFSCKLHFPNLECLTLSANNNIQHIWNYPIPEMSSFVQNLTQFIVEGLGNLKYLLKSSMIKSFEQLKWLEVHRCKMMKEVILREGLAEEDMMCEMLFPKLENLFLDDLPKLTRFCCGNYYEFSNLAHLTIMKCPLLETFITSAVTGDIIVNNEVENTNVRSLFDEKVAFPRLVLLGIRDMGSLKKIWNDQLEAGSFCKLKYFHASCCETLTYIFPFNMLEKLHQLEKVCIVDCGSLEEIFEPHRDCAQELQDNWVPEMPSFVLTINELIVERCGNLRHLLTCSVVKISFEHLKLLCISDCKMMEGIIVTEGFVKEKRIHKMFFPDMESLRLGDLPKLTRFCDGNYVDLPCLNGLEISNCPLLKTFLPSPVTEDKAVNTHEKAEITFIPALFDAKVALPRLKALMIQHMESLNKIWDDKLDEHSFCKLEAFSVLGCQGLARIFTSCMLERLQGLDTLWIGNCDSLEEIHEPHGLSASHSQPLIETEPTSMGTDETKLVFPKLTYLGLYLLPNLKRFCHQIHKWPSLKKLEVVGCEQVQVFASAFPSLKRTSGHDELEIQIQCPLFWVTKATFPNLEELNLQKNDILKEIWRGKFAGVYFSKLKVLELILLPEQVVVPPFFFQSFPSLEKLVVCYACFNEIFQSEGLGDEENPALAQLSELRLSNLNELTHIWNYKSDLGFVFYSLRTLKVLECGKLMNLVPSIISLKNLQTLEVSRCNGLINLVRYSTAKSLVQLKTLSISHCDMVEEIVAGLDDEAKDDIIFSQLKYLQLSCLPRLTTFCSVECNFEFPSLEDLIVMDCPTLKFFSKGELSTPKLQNVKLTEKDDEGHWDGDLNTTLKQMLRERSIDGSDED